MFSLFIYFICSISPGFLGFSCSPAGQESTCNMGDLGLIPGLGRSPGEGKGYPLQYSGLENCTDCIDHGVAKSGTRLGDFHFVLEHNADPFANLKEDASGPWRTMQSDESDFITCQHWDKISTETSAWANEAAWVTAEWQGLQRWPCVMHYIQGTEDVPGGTCQARVL